MSSNLDKIGMYGGFDWDNGNATKNLAKHGVRAAMIEALFNREPLIAEDPRHSRLERRLLAVGQLEAGRWLLVSFTVRLRNGVPLIRPISARYMHAKEVKIYEKEDSK
jgi:uncharacterized DUF497 family protein